MGKDIILKVFMNKKTKQMSVNFPKKKIKKKGKRVRLEIKGWLK